MFEWIKRQSAPLSLRVTLSCGSLIAGSNWHKRDRIRTGHKEDSVKRYKSITGRIIPCPTQGNGYKDTAGYKYTSTCNIVNNTKTFYGNNIQMVKKLAENHYRQVLKLAIIEATPDGGKF